MAGKKHEGPTRIEQACALADKGWSVSEIATHMGILSITVQRYLLPQAEYSMHNRKNRPQENYPEDDKFNDMVQYRDKHGIVRWGKKDRYGNLIKKKPTTRRWLNPVPIEDLT